MIIFQNYTQVNVNDENLRPQFTTEFLKKSVVHFKAEFFRQRFGTYAISGGQWPRPLI